MKQCTWIRLAKEDIKVKKQAFNPYLPSWEYIPDGEPYVFGDRVYIYGSHDYFNGYVFCMGDYVCWSAPVDDLGNWRYEGVIYPKTADPLNPEGKMCLYAPDVTVGPDGRYYLYYVLDKVSVVSVAVCDTPAGKYEFYGYVHYEDGTRLGEKEGDEPQFDPGVLTEGDVTYLYTGFCGKGDKSRTGAMVTVLGADMLTIRVSIIGIFLVRTKEGATMRELLRSLGVGVNFSSLLIALATFGILYLLGIENWVGLSFSVITGLVAGVVIGQATEYYTSHSYRPTQKIAGSSKTGPATVIIAGVGSGMISTAIPVVTIGVAIILAYLCAIGFDIHHMMTPQNLSQGLYGIGIAAVGMLSTLGITLATDAYGPIADNAGGNAEMSGLGPEVRKRTDALDALGNTTAATGKGFAIGSAALTALALLASYVEEIRIGLLHNGVTELVFTDGTRCLVEQASILDFMSYYNVSLMNPTVLVGVFIGAMMSFLFCGLTMNAVGRAAESMVQEVRRQFREIKGILTGEGTPDYARCVAISTRGAQREMLFPSLLAIIVPVVVGLVFGVAGVMGLLVGGLGSGFVLAVFMANAGGAWDNAKKMVEEGHFGGKGSECHKATVVGDTVGDPFKDTSGPSLNILIKLMSMVAIVMAGLTVAFHLF